MKRLLSAKWNSLSTENNNDGNRLYYIEYKAKMRSGKEGGKKVLSYNS